MVLKMDVSFFEQLHTTEEMNYIQLQEIHIEKYKLHGGINIDPLHPARIGLKAIQLILKVDRGWVGKDTTILKLLNAAQ